MKKMLVVVAALAILAISSLAMATLPDVNPWRPVTIDVNLTVDPIGELSWVDGTPAVELHVVNFGINTAPTVTRHLWVLSNVAQVAVSFAIKAGTDINPWTVLQVSALGTTLNFRRDGEPASYVVGGSNVLFTKAGSPLGSNTTSPENIVPVTFAAEAWNGVAAAATANLTLETTLTIP
jgi:hypothetical protein